MRRLLRPVNDVCSGKPAPVMPDERLPRFHTLSGTPAASAIARQRLVKAVAA